MKILNAGCPRADGFYMPAEYAPHKGCLLYTSLDISSRNLALRGEESFAKVAQMSEYARQEINSRGGYYAYGRDLVNGSSIYDYDVTKLSIYTLDIGLAGIEAVSYTHLDVYKRQVLGDAESHELVQLLKLI